MRHKTLAVVCLLVALGCLLFAVFGQTSQSIFLAVGIVFLILSYAANRRPLSVDPFTGQKRDRAGNEVQTPTE
jgi:hypothetical protein